MPDIGAAFLFVVAPFLFLISVHIARAVDRLDRIAAALEKRNELEKWH
jgi:hypothetical protein